MSRGLRNDIPRPACRNRPHLPYTGQGNYTIGLPNPNPWSESSPFPGPIPPQPCQNNGAVAIEMRRCQGHQTANVAPTHAVDVAFWVCRTCALHAWQMYDFTKYPPWFQAFCNMCTIFAIPPAAQGCNCVQKYRPTNNGWWMRSDCRQQYSRYVDRRMMRYTRNTLPTAIKEFRGQISDEESDTVRSIASTVRTAASAGGSTGPRYLHHIL